MKTHLALLIAVMLNFCPANPGLYAQSRAITGINSSWKFKLGDDPNASKPLFDDSGWGIISLPHTWNNLDGEDGGNNYFRGVGWYRRTFHLGSISGKRVFLRFNSANLVTDVYVNGSLAGRHTGGYSAFIFDITNLALTAQDNVVAVRVSNDATLRFAPLSGDFNFCGGITGGAELWVTSNILISPLDYASPGIYITPKNITASRADVNVDAVLGNFSASSCTVTETYNIKNAGNTIIATLNSSSIISANNSLNVTRSLSVSNPVLWQGMKNPYLYTLEVILKVNGTEVDRLTQKFGIRTITANPDLGTFLNGLSYPLRGMALHEDRKDKGRAISDKDRKEDLDLLRETGLNYLRLTHYQHGQATYNYCDSTGIVISTEIPLIEQIENSTAFTDNIKDQLRELIKQNYNHPSVCFWGLFNELFSKAGPDPTQLVFDLNTLAKTLDNSRLTTASSMTDGSACNFYTDVISFNRYFGWYYNDVSKIRTFLDSMHTLKPANAIGLSEYGAGASIRQHEDNPSEPLNGGPYHPEEYQNYFHEYYLNAIKQRPYLLSTAVWNAFDFASDSRDEGDARGINDKGLVTHDRQTKKDAFYLYKANWSSSPFVYITSRRFTERKSASTTIKVYSNADSVEIRVNNKSKGYQKSTDHVLLWKNITLDDGINRVTAFGVKNKIIYQDSCSWICTSSSIVRSDGCGNITARSGNNASEAASMAFDNLNSTKWYNFNTSGVIWIQYQFCNSASYAINSYSLTSANDMPLRDPKTVSISGSNDGTNFTLLDTKTNIVFSSRYQTQTFTFTNSTAYQYYRLEMASNTGNDGLQVAEIELIESGQPGTSPNPPSGLTATAASNTSISLTWQDNSSNETGFEIYHSTTSGTGYTLLTTTAANVTAYTHTGLTASSTHYYRIRAVNAQGNSAYTSEASATTLPASGTPIVRSDGCGNITARSGNNASEAASMAFDNLNSTKWYNFNTTGVIWIQYQFCNSASYAINSYSLTSANDMPLRDPKTVSISGSNDGANFTLLDTKTNIVFSSRYQTQTFTFTNSTAYQYYRLEMTSNTGNDGLQIAEIELIESGQPGTSPNPPSGLTATAASNTSISLTWQDNSSNETGFEIYHSTTSGTGYTLLTTTAANVTAYTHTGLTASSTHYYRIRAVNAQGNSAYTSEASATTLPASGTPIVRSDGCGNITARSGNNASEAAAMAFDNLNSTKWYNFNTTGVIWIQYQFCNSASYAINSYSLTSANDMPLRDPKTVSISGSNDGTNFTLLDTKTNIVFSSRYQTQTFTFTNSTAYQYFRLEMTSNTGNDGLQIAEIELIESGQPGTSPNPPSGLTAAAASNTSISLTWQDNSSNESGFEIYHSTTSGTGYTLLTTTAANVTTYTHTGLTASSTHYYRIRAVNAQGNSAYTSEASATTLPASGTPIVRSDGCGIVTARSGNNASEAAAMAFDNLNSTKWYNFNTSGVIWIQYQFCNSASYAINSYSLTSANDMPLRDPKTVSISGSNDGTNFTLLDTKTNIVFSSRYQTQTFTFTNSTAYQYYRLEMASNTGNDGLQVAEIELIESGAVLKSTQITPPAAITLTVSPNPFRDALTIDYSLPGDTRVSLAVYDLNGRIVRQLANENQGEGPHRIVWDALNYNGGNLHNGIYILKIESAFGTGISKVIYME